MDVTAGVQEIAKGPPEGTPVEYWLMAILSIGLIQIALAALKKPPPPPAASSAGSALTPEEKKQIARILDLTKDLHEWHDKRDEDDVFRWWIGRSMRKAIEALPGIMTKLLEATRTGNAELVKMNDHQANQTRALDLLLERSGEHALEVPDGE